MNIQTKETKRPNNTTAWDVRTERDSKRARLINYSNGKTVELLWDYNEAVTRDGMVLMKIGNEEAVLNAEELRRFLRWS